MEVAFIGNSAATLGPAADLDLAGHSVRISGWPGRQTPASDSAFMRLEQQGHVDLVGDAEQTVSGRTGLAAPALKPDLAAAVRGAEILFLEMGPADFESHFEALTPHLEAGQIVHVNGYGGWPSLRLAPMLRRLGIEDIILTESNAPTMVAIETEASVDAMLLRRGLPVAAFPASKTEAALSRFRALYSTVVAARNIFETGFSNLDMLVHPALNLLNIASRDRAAEAGERLTLYGPGNTPSVGRLAEALDAERATLCAAWSVPWRGVGDYIRTFYGAQGDGFHDIVKHSAFYQSLPAQPADLYVQWALRDMPYAHAPMVALAGITGTPLPLQSALLSIFGAIYRRDFAAEGLGLSNFKLVGADRESVLHYVETGEI